MSEWTGGVQPPLLLRGSPLALETRALPLLQSLPSRCLLPTPEPGRWKRGWGRRAAAAPCTCPSTAGFGGGGQARAVDVCCLGSPQIFMKYGRQRWKLKGKIEVNGRQSWDGEETVFLPLIAGLISIKVQCSGRCCLLVSGLGDPGRVPRRPWGRWPLCRDDGALSSTASPSRSLSRSRRSKGWQPTS